MIFEALLSEISKVKFVHWVKNPQNHGIQPTDSSKFDPETETLRPPEGPECSPNRSYFFHVSP